MALFLDYRKTDKSECYTYIQARRQLLLRVWSYRVFCTICSFSPQLYRTMLTGLRFQCKRRRWVTSLSIQFRRNNERKLFEEYSLVVAAPFAVAIRLSASYIETVNNFSDAIGQKKFRMFVLRYFPMYISIRWADFVVPENRVRAKWKCMSIIGVISWIGHKSCNQEYVSGQCMVYWTTERN